MQKLLLLIGASCFISAYAQQPANGGFENWTVQTLYEDPDTLISTNSWVYMSTSNGNVSKDPGSYHGNFAARLTTVQTPNDTMFGGLFIGMPSQNGIAGGIPYSDQPDSISGYVRYFIQPNDTAWFIVGFKNGGTIISMTVKYFTGSQGSYQRFSIPTYLPPSPAPDTIVAIIVSSRMDPPRYAGSTITIDSISMIGAVQPFPNYSFEDWTPFITEEPDNWQTINFASAGIPSVTKTTQSISGTYALRLESVETVWGDTSGYITNGYMGPNGPEGGMQVFQNPMKITGFYKYFPVGPDTAIAGAWTYKNSLGLDSNVIKLNAQSIYTYFEIPLNYNNWPYADTLNISFASSNLMINGYVGLGSVLYLDDLNVIYYATGVVESYYANISHSLNPNPFSSVAVLTFNNLPDISYDLEIYDLPGNLVMRKENISSSSVLVSRENLASGAYVYRVNESKTSKLIARGKLIIQ